MKVLRIEVARAVDDQRLRQVVVDAINGPRSRYDRTQTAAWADHLPSSNAWSERLASQEVFAACDGTRIFGFMSLTPSGLVDFAFIHPEYQETGLFGRLFDAVEREARARGIAQLSVKASVNAKGPFLKAGFTLIEREEAPLGDVTLTRFHMTKPLRILNKKEEPNHA